MDTSNSCRLAENKGGAARIVNVYLSGCNINNGRDLYTAPADLCRIQADTIKAQAATIAQQQKTIERLTEMLTQQTK